MTKLRQADIGALFEIRQFVITALNIRFQRVSGCLGITAYDSAVCNFSL